MKSIHLSLLVAALASIPSLLFADIDVTSGTYTVTTANSSTGNVTVAGGSLYVIGAGVLDISDDYYFRLNAPGSVNITGGGNIIIRTAASLDGFTETKNETTNATLGTYKTTYDKPAFNLLNSGGTINVNGTNSALNFYFVRPTVAASVSATETRTYNSYGTEISSTILVSDGGTFLSDVTVNPPDSSNVYGTVTYNLNNIYIANAGNITVTGSASRFISNITGSGGSGTTYNGIATGSTGIVNILDGATANFTSVTGAVGSAFAGSLIADNARINLNSGGTSYLFRASGANDIFRNGTQIYGNVVSGTALFGNFSMNDSSLVIDLRSASNGIGFQSGGTTTINNSTLLFNQFTTGSRPIVQTVDGITMTDSSFTINRIALPAGQANTGSAIEIRVGSITASGSAGRFNIEEGNTNTDAIWVNGTNSGRLTNLIFTNSLIANLNSTRTNGNIINLDGPYATFTMNQGATTHLNYSGDGGTGIYNAGKWIMDSGATFFSNATSGTNDKVYIAATGQLTINGTDTAFHNNDTAGTGIHNTGIINLSNGGSIHNKAGAKILIDGNGTLVLNNGGSIDLSAASDLTYNGTIGSTARLAGNGTYAYNTGFNSIYDILSPGDFAAGTSSIGKLTFNAAQTWSSMTYEWQLANTTKVNGTSHDFVQIDAPLTLSGSAYQIKILNGTLSDAATLRNNLSRPTFQILASTSSISGFNRANWTIDALDFIKTNKLGGWFVAGNITDGYAGGTIDPNGIYLTYAEYAWRAATDAYRDASLTPNGTWSSASDTANKSQWETDSAPDRAGANVHFIRDQSALATVTIDTGTRTVGNITIGSENNSSTTSYNITGGNIALNGNGGTSTITHHAKAQTGDTIASNITLSNNLTIDLQSPNALTITGDITDPARSYNLLIEGRNGAGAIVLNAASTLTITVQNANATLNTLGNLGGFKTYSAGNITITNSTFLNNASGGTGISADGLLNILGGTFTNNVSGDATGISADSANRHINIGNSTASTIFKNEFQGGSIRSGISANSINTTITNTTFTNNVNAISDTAAGITIGGGNLNILGGSFYNNVNRGIGINVVAIGALNIGSFSTATLFENNYKAASTSTPGIAFIFNTGTITNTTFTNNANGAGNAIEANGNLFITGGSFLNNTTSGNGIYSASSRNIYIGNITAPSSTSFTNNYSDGTAGIYNTGSTLSIANTTFNNNAKGPANAIYNAGVLSIDQTEFTNDVSSGTGIYSTDPANAGKLFAILSSNITNNVTGTSTGIHNDASQLIINNSNITNTGDTSATALYNSNTGTGVLMTNNTRMSLTNTTLVNAGCFTIVGGASITLGEKAILLNSGDFGSTTTGIDLTGGNQILSGNGRFNLSALNNLHSTTRLSPGNSTDKTGANSIGSLTINSTQAITSFTYDWQLDAANTASYDQLNLGSTTTLDNSADYILNLSALNPATIANQNYSWTIMGGTGLASGIGNWTLANENNFLSQLGLNGSLSLVLDQDLGNFLYLTFTALTDFVWRENTTGLWSETAKWESDPTFNAAGKTVYFTRNQSAGNGIVTIDNTTATVGNITIGSDVGFHSITGNNITFDGDSGTSTLTHAANAQAGDTIASRLIIRENDLTIEALSSNTLLLTGMISGGRNLTITGGGNVEFQSQGIDLGDITIQDSSTATLSHDRGASLFGIENGRNILVQDNSTLNINNTGTGEGIYNAGDITVDASTLNTRVTAGTGITNTTTMAVLNGSTLVNTVTTNSSSPAYGILNYGTLDIADSTLVNTLDGDILTSMNTRAIQTDGGSVNITNSDITNNISGGGRNWGIATFDGSLDITDSTLTNNVSGIGNYVGDFEIAVAIYANNSTVNITNSTVHNDITTGGGIGVENGATLNIIDSTFTNNITGGTYNFDTGFGVNEGAINITNTTLTNNVTGGNGIFNGFGTLTISESNVTSTTGTSSYSSNGIFNSSTLLIEDSTYTNNVSGGYGIYNGAPLDNGGLPISLTISNTTFINNVIHNGIGGAIGIYASGKDTTIEITNGTTLTNDITGGYGFDLYDGTTLNIADSSLTNNIFYNSEFRSSYGISAYGDTDNRTDIDITNSTLTQNIGTSITETYLRGIIISAGNLSITDSTFNNNLIGGTGVEGINIYDGTLTITNTTFTQILNGTGEYIGGNINMTLGIVTFDSELVIEGGHFINNVSGGVGIGSDTSSNFHLRNTTFDNNYTGGIYDLDLGIGIIGGNINISNTTFTNNANSVNGLGNAIYIAGGDINISEGSFLNNVTSGTGILIDSAATLNIDNATFTQNINGTDSHGIYAKEDTSLINISNTTAFTQNVSGAGSYAIYVNGGSTLNIINSTLTSNSDDGAAGIRNTGDINITDSTLASNATEDAYGIYNRANLAVSNSTLNLNGDGVEIYNEGLATITDGAQVNLGANATIRNLGEDSHSTSTLSFNNATLAIDGTITGGTTSSIAFTENARITGTGTINDWTLIQATPGNNVRIAPGANNGASVGTLSFIGSHDWSNLTYDWTLANLGIGQGATIYSGNDNIDINGYLWLGTTGALSLNILADASLDTTSLLADLATNGGSKSYSLISSNNVIIFNTDLETDTTILNKAAALAALGLTGQADLLLSLGDSNHTLLLQLVLTSTDYIWRENKTGLWSQGTTVWELDPTFNAPGKTIYFTRNQSAGNGSVTIDQATATLGNLTIGSDIGFHTITDNTIAFDGDSGSSTLTHAANAQAGDTINSNITFSNDLAVQGLSANALTLNGVILGSANLSMTGNIILNTNTLTGTANHNITVKNFTVTSANLTQNHNSAGNGIYVGSGNRLWIGDSSNYTQTVGAGNGIYTTGTTTFSGGNLNSTLDGALNSTTAIHTGSGGQTTFTDGVVVNSTASKGLGIRNNGATATTRFSNATLISDFTSIADNSGSAINNNGGNFIVTDGSRFEMTNAGGNSINNYGSFYLSNSTLDLTHTYTSGYGIYNEYALSRAAIFTLNAGATLNSTNLSGDGIYNYNSTLTITEGSRLNAINAGTNGIYTNGTNATFTINGASTINSTTSSGGNGISVVNKANFTLTEASLLDSTSTSTGGGRGIYIDNANFTINGASTLNSTNKGTDIGLSAQNSNFTLSNATINNINNGTGGGTGINNYNSVFLITDRAVLNSTNNGSGWGTHIYNYDYGIGKGFIISNATLNAFNEGTSNSDGIYNYGNFTVTDGGTLNANSTIGNGFYQYYNSNITVNGASTINFNTSGSATGLFNDGACGTATTIISGDGTTFNSINNGTGNGIRNSNKGNITIADGAKLSNIFNGSAGNGIYNSGNITVRDGATLENTHNGSGSNNAFYNAGGNLNITNATLNSTISNGYGIYNQYSNDYSRYGNITINNNSTLNVVNSGGGYSGIYNSGGTFIVENSTLNIESSATNSGGNGIQNYTNLEHEFRISGSTVNAINTGAGSTIGSCTTFTINNDTTFEALNTGSGNVIYMQWGDLNIDNSTFKLTNNGTGTNINTPQAINLSNSTLTNNVSSTGTGILMTGESNLTLTNSTLNTTATGSSTGIYIDTDKTLHLSVDGSSTFNITSSDTANGILNNGGNLSIAGGSTLNITNTGAGNGIFSSNGANINIYDDNAIINVTNTGAGNGILNDVTGSNGYASINNTANLTINSTNTGSGAGIYNTGNFTNRGNLTLNLSGVGAFVNEAADAYTSLYNDGPSGTFTINGGTFINIVSSGTGIHNSGAIILNNNTFNSTTASSGGYGIYNNGNLTLNGNSTLNSTAFDFTYGIYNDGGTITLNGNSTVNATVSDDSLGIYNSGTIYLTGNSTLNSNTNASATNNAYGIYNENNIHLTGNSTLNAANSGNGNSIFNVYSTITLTGNSTLDVTNSGAGNGIYNILGTITLTGNSTLNSNTNVGNGIYNEEGTITIANGSTFNITSTGANGAGLYNDGGTINLTNATLISTGAGLAIDNQGGAINLGENARLYHNVGTINSTNAINVTGNNVTIAGAGTINAAISGVGGKYGTALGTNANTTFSPGANGTAIGTLTLNSSQTWVHGFNIDWQMGSTTQNLGFNDLLKITGTLTLDDDYENFDLAYMIKISGLGLSSSSTAPADGMYWTVLQADNILNFNPLLWNDSGDFRNSANDLISTLGLSGQGRFTITGNSTEIGITYQAISAFIWNSGLSGDWMTGSNWENNWAPDISTLAPDADVYLIRNQTGTTGNIDLGGDTITIGSLTIGSENITATDTHYLVKNGTLAFKDSSGTSELSHSEFAQGDEISADIVLENQLGLLTTANGTLTLSGNITGNSQLAVFGDGVAVIKGTNSNLGSARFDIMESGASLFFDGATLKTTGMTTIVGGATIGGHGTLDGNITFQHAANLNFRDRPGAKYSDKFTVTGSSTFQGGSTLFNLANFQLIVSDDPANGSSRMITNQQNVLWTNSLSLNATAQYTLNLYNEGEYHIQDWTVEKSDFGVYYALILSSSDFLNFNADNWTINWTNGSPWNNEIWEIVKADHNGLHGIWLHYKNPNRIPEPSTYAALIAALALIVTLIAKRRKRT